LTSDPERKLWVQPASSADHHAGLIERCFDHDYGDPKPVSHSLISGLDGVSKRHCRNDSDSADIAIVVGPKLLLALLDGYELGA
jgi:hypothetical protein